MGCYGTLTSSVKSLQSIQNQQPNIENKERVVLRKLTVIVGDVFFQQKTAKNINNHKIIMLYSNALCQNILNQFVMNYQLSQGCINVSNQTRLGCL